MTDPTPTPNVTYDWPLTGVPILEQKCRYDRSTVRIPPRSIEVTRSTHDLTRMRVVIEGRTVRLDGELGPHNRSCGYGGRSFLEPDPAEHIDQLPAWARPYYDEAMHREGLAP